MYDVKQRSRYSVTGKGLGTSYWAQNVANFFIAELYVHLVEGARPS